jgi:hypothetical protein
LLELHQNKVSEVPDGAFNKNLNLYKLQLNENRIAKIGEATFSPELRSKFSWLDLSGNPFICDCDLRWFSDYLRTNHTPFRHSWTTYNCSNLDDKPVESFHVVAQACIWNQTIHKAIIAAVSIFIIILCLVAFLFHYRWLFKLKVRCCKCQIKLCKIGSAVHVFFKFNTDLYYVSKDITDLDEKNSTLGKAMGKEPKSRSSLQPPRTQREPLV